MTLTFGKFQKTENALAIFLQKSTQNCEKNAVYFTALSLMSKKLLSVEVRYFKQTRAISYVCDDGGQEPNLVLI